MLFAYFLDLVLCGLIEMYIKKLNNSAKILSAATLQNKKKKLSISEP